MNHLPSSMSLVLFSLAYFFTSCAPLEKNEPASEPSSTVTASAPDESIEDDGSSAFAIYGPQKMKTTSNTINTKQANVDSLKTSMTKECSAIALLLPEYNESVMANNAVMRGLVAKRDKLYQDIQKLRNALSTKRIDLAKDIGDRSALVRYLALLDNPATLLKLLEEATAKVNQSIKDTTLKISQLKLAILLANDADIAALEKELNDTEVVLNAFYAEKSKLEELAASTFENKVDQTNIQIEQLTKKIVGGRSDIAVLTNALKLANAELTKTKAAIVANRTANGVGPEELPQVCTKI